MLVVLSKTQGSDRTPSSLLLFQFRQNANDTGRMRVGWAGGRREREREDSGESSGERQRGQVLHRALTTL